MFLLSPKQNYDLEKIIVVHGFSSGMRHSNGMSNIQVCKGASVDGNLSDGQSRAY